MIASIATHVSTRVTSPPAARAAATTASTICAPTQATPAGKAPATSVSKPSATLSDLLVVQTSSSARPL